MTEVIACPFCQGTGQNREIIWTPAEGGGCNGNWGGMMSCMMCHGTKEITRVTFEDKPIRLKKS